MSGAHAAIHAAQERRKQQQEEEEMTHYRKDELEQGWEFKIVRSVSNAFRNPQTLANVLENEAIGGWELVEKFDDGRLRFKRPAASRRKDAMLPAGYDPYRTRYGISEAALALWIVTIIMGLTGILVAVGTYLQW